MKNLITFLIFILICFDVIVAQSRTELEERRKKTIEEINYVDKLLTVTAKEKSENIKSLSIINKKLNLRENVISGIKDEIQLLNYRVELNSLAVNMMEEDLLILKREYSKAVYNAFKTDKGYPELVYILSAKDFNQGYKRVKYLQQITKFRRREAEIILELKEQINESKIRLQADLNKLSDLKTKEEVQKDLLQKEKKGKQNLVKVLNRKERELKQELEEKRKIARKIELEINRLIEEERKKAASRKLSEGQKVLGDNFNENKGKLPWPVDQGVITSHFGVQKHPEFKYLTEDNIGIEITSSGSTAVKAVFKGEVAKVFSIPGANMTVIIRHGNYLSVYANLVNVKVKTGDAVNNRQVIGDVYNDSSENNISVLKFMIFENEKKYLDPEIWITKN